GLALDQGGDDQDVVRGQVVAVRVRQVKGREVAFEVVQLVGDERRDGERDPKLECVREQESLQRGGAPGRAVGGRVEQRRATCLREVASLEALAVEDLVELDAGLARDDRDPCGLRLRGRGGQRREDTREGHALLQVVGPR